jgi:uncharacterized protein YjbI with pentapeptide repeats
MNKVFISLISWLVGAYFVLFILCLYVHVNESNIIAKKANSLLPKLNYANIIELSKVSEVQNMKRISRPNIFQPYTLFYSLLGERQSDKAINRILGKAIERLKENLNGSILNDTDLREANLSNGKLWEANLEKSMLHNAKFIGAELTKARLNESILINADLSNAILLEASLSQANLQGANLRNTNLISTKLNFSNLHKADFRNANFFKADLSNAILNGANLVSGINITCEQIKSAWFDKGTRFPDYISIGKSSSANLNCKNLRKGKGVDISGRSLKLANLNFTNFRNSNLSHANLTQAKLFAADFYNTNLRKANLKGANLNLSYNLTCDQIESAVIDKNTRLPDYILLDRSSPTNFSCKNLMKGKGLNLIGLNLVNSNLYHADLRETNLSHTSLMQSFLGNVNFGNANLRGANLEGANLTAAHFENTNLRKANLKGANLDRVSNLTCDQIESAVIDKNTRLPDYITLTGSLESAYECKNRVREKLGASK